MSRSHKDGARSGIHLHPAPGSRRRKGQDMKSLFLKIFLSYWMAQALFLALAILITLAMRERGESAIWDAQQPAVFSKAVQTYEQSGPAEVRRYLEEVRDSLHTRVYLLNEQGEDVSGRE